MPQSLDDHLPKKVFQLPDKTTLSIGVMWDQESCRQLVLFHLCTFDSPERTVEFAVSAESADVIAAAIQENANSARFINGKPLLVYPKPVRAVPIASKRTKKSQK